MKKLFEYYKREYKKQPFLIFLLSMFLMGGIDMFIVKNICLTCNDNVVEGGIGFGMLGFFYGFLFIAGSIKERFSNALAGFMSLCLLGTLLFLIGRLGLGLFA
jgi:hypothetical protein